MILIKTKKTQYKHHMQKHLHWMNYGSNVYDIWKQNNTIQVQIMYCKSYVVSHKLTKHVQSMYDVECAFHAPACFSQATITTQIPQLKKQYNNTECLHSSNKSLVTILYDMPWCSMLV